MKHTHLKSLEAEFVRFCDFDISILNKGIK